MTVDPAVERPHARPCTPSVPARRSRRSICRAISSATSPRASGRRSSSSTTSSILRPATSRPAALAAAVSAGTADLPTSPARRATAPGPLVVEQYVLTNPALNYAQFLLRAILPTVLHIVVAIAAGYAVGSEFGSRNLSEWLEAAGGDPLTALVGKLAPYFGIFVLLMVAAGLTIHRGYEVPFRGSAVADGGGRMPARRGLSVARRASPVAGAQPRFRPQPDGHHLFARLRFRGSRFSGPGNGRLSRRSGARFCRCAGTSRSCSTRRRAACRPSIRSSRLPPLRRWRWPTSASRCFACDRSPASLAAGAGERYADEGSPTDRHRRRLRRRNTGRVLRDRGAFGLFVLAPLLYGVFYPQPYLGQLVRAIPIAVVDSDSSELSREHHRGPERLGGAAGGGAARVRSPTRRQALARREVFAILDIPAGTERDVLAGRQARLPAYVDSVYFLLYNRTLEGILEATGIVTAELLSRDARPTAACIARRWRKALRWRC